MKYQGDVQTISAVKKTRRHESESSPHTRYQGSQRLVPLEESKRFMQQVKRINQRQEALEGHRLLQQNHPNGQLDHRQAPVAKADKWAQQAIEPFDSKSKRS